MKNFFSMMCLLGLFGVSYANDAVELRAGVILDKTSQSVITMLPGGGVAAFDLQTGETRWSSAHADKPLKVQSGQVLSQKEVHQKGLLTLVYQSVTDGAIHKSIDLDLPRKVMANVINGAGPYFEISPTHTHPENQLHWIFRGKKISGVAPRKEHFFSNKESARRPKYLIKSGLIDLDFNNHKATNGHISTAHKAKQSRIEQTVLNDVTGRQFLSQDGKHVLVSRRIDSNKAIQYQWQIHKLSGEMLGLLIADNSYAPFVVEGELLLFMTAAKGSLVDNKLIKTTPFLTAVDLQTNQVLWENAVRSIKYFGQLPH